MRRNRGFTLVELIIVIAILVIIMLIASLAYGGIQERMRIRADKATCAEIGKALAVREADVAEDKKIELYPKVVEYNEFEDISTYIQDDLVPQSMPDGGYIVTAVQTNAGKKILVGIGKEGLVINGDSIYQNKEEIGWVFSEGKDIVEFLDESGEKMDDDAKEKQSGEKNVVLKSGIGGSVDSEVTPTPTGTSSEVAVGAYIAYTPSETSYTVETSESGYDSDQNFTPNTYISGWRVFKNNAGQLDIISAGSIGNLALEGATGYAKAVNTLNSLSSAYVNSTYATSGRSLGCTNSSRGEIDTTLNPLMFVFVKSQVFPYHDTYHETDINQLENNSLLYSSGTVWLASRSLITDFWGSRFCVRCFSSDYGVDECGLYDSYSNDTSYPFSYSYGVRPIISLKSGIRITGGSGTQSNPYTIAN